MFNAINRYFQNHGRHKAREQLLNMSDRQLEDMGLSRDLLRRYPLLALARRIGRSTSIQPAEKDDDSRDQQGSSGVIRYVR